MDSSTILIVAEDDTSLDPFRGVLEQEDCRVVRTNNAEAAVQLARQHLPAVVLVDLALPGDAGEAVARALKTNPSTAHIPRLAVMHPSASSPAPFTARIDTAVELEGLLQHLRTATAQR